MTTAGATVALVLATVLVQPAVGSASPAPPGSAARTGVPAAPSSGAAARAASRLPVPLSGGAYVYTDGNTCPNDIDVFKVEGSQLSEVQQLTVGCSAGTTFGTHYLLVAGAGSCLVFSDDGDGQVDTFTIDPTTGELSSTPVSTVDVGGRPGDLTAIGSTIVESNTGLATLDTFSLGSGCALT
ncbi:MAG TPA: hypothetical protein VKV25_02555, partial [Acidimicrobiales bacterium]|nr:hypothetical protein [Acidimicrobiales bacterium]